MNSHLDHTFYDDFYKRVSIFLRYYTHLFGNADLVLTVITGDKVYYRGLDAMELPNNKKTKEAVAFLKENGYSIKDKRYFTANLLEKFRKQRLWLWDCGPFSIDEFLMSKRSALRGHEKVILRSVVRKHQSGSCLALPLISMANLVGTMTVFWEPNEDQPEELIQNSMEVLIKMCSREYESMLVFKDLDFLDEAANITLKHRYDVLIHRSGLHPFLSEMGYADYYRVFGEQFLRYNQKILHVKEKVDRQDIKTAIISIVVDSFAHNVGAHSLTALKWWIQKRSELLEYKFRFGKNTAIQSLSPTEVSFEDLKDIAKQNAKFYRKIGRNDVKPNIASLAALVKHLPQEMEEEMLSFEPILRDVKSEKSGKYRPQFPLPIDYAVWPFLEYMRDKSAFWSGVSRDIVYSGEAISWYDLLWRDFINNPLFLGTIAHSEGIHKLNIWLCIKDENGKVKEDGLFAQIDLSLIDREIALIEQLHEEQYESREELPAAPHEVAGIRYGNYGFIRLSAQFERLKQALESLPEVFLPNGIIGKHAFYTIIENTLRNVKHFREEYKNMQENGIQLWLSVQETSFEDRPRRITADSPNLFQFGVWLQHDIALVQPDIDESQQQPVFFRYLSRLQENIVNQYGQPNLGGNSQDKICASMLLNNTFKSVVETDPQHAKVGYWPYVHIESRIHTDKGIETYMPPTVPLEGEYLNQEIKEYLLKYPKGSKGYIAKYLYLWKAESLKIIDEEEGLDPRGENLSRFRVIAAKNLSLADARERFRKQGVIRVVSWEDLDLKEGQEEQWFEQAYVAWLQEWLGGKAEQLQALVSIRESPIGLITLNSTGINYLNYQSLYSSFDAHLFEGRQMELAHGQSQGQEVCEVRSHGTFLKYFYSGVGFQGLATYQFNDNIKLLEMAEAWLTGISIIDNRIHKRLPNSKRHVLDEQLNLRLFPEKDEVWTTHHKQLTGSNTNFLILHLSFIESFQGQRYTANDIDSFVHEQIGSVEELPENFIVVITTGRGRSGWLETIEDPKITFRPIEALVDAFEDGLSIQDFFQIKYNLMKVLMGS